MRIKLHKFYKIQGNGNDFIIFDLRDNMFLEEWDSQFKRAETEIRSWIKQICELKWGVGADGVVVLTKSKDPSIFLNWSFYNKDGTTASMCGNASRCIGRYLLQKNELQDAVQIQIGKIVTGVKYTKQEVGVQFPIPKVVQSHIENEKTWLIDSGVPHFVIETTNRPSEKEMATLIHKFRWHTLAGKEGANVTCFWKSQDKVESFTFERGVEGVTLACGTGVLAVAQVVQTSNEVEVNVPGGKMYVNKLQNGMILFGKTKLVFTGELEEDWVWTV